MTAGQKGLRRVLLAKIHLHEFTKQSKEAGAWEEFLWSGWQANSSAELSISELYNLLDVLEGKSEPRKIGRRIKKSPQKDSITPAQYATILNLWEEKARDKSLESLMRFVKRITGELYIGPHVLKKANATKVLIALQRMK